MAAKKKAGKKISNKDMKQIKAAISRAEDKLLANYKKAVSMSGADWKKEGKRIEAKVKKDMAVAKKKIETQVRNNPAGAAVAAAAVGAIVGALVMSQVMKKKK